MANQDELALIRAAMKDDETLTKVALQAKQLIKQRAKLPEQIGSNPLNFDFIQGLTLLHAAAGSGKEAVVRLFINWGIDVNVTTNKGTQDGVYEARCTPLHIAVRGGHYNIARLLLENGAKVDAVTSKGFTALHVATRNEDERLVRLLAEKGADINRGIEMSLQSNKLEEAFEARSTALHIAVGQGNYDIARLLLENGAIVDAVSSSGVTALYWAVRIENERMVRLIVEKGANVNLGFDMVLMSNEAERGSDAGITALHMAVGQGHYAIARFLLENGAMANAVTRKKITALHVAASNGGEDLVRLLVDRGADINAVDDQQLTPFSYFIAQLRRSLGDRTERWEAMADLALLMGEKDNARVIDILQGQTGA